MIRALSLLGLCLGLLLHPGASGTARAHAADAKALRCLAMTLYWEAKGEGYDGMIAVAAVVLNRVEHPNFPSSVCGVVHDGREEGPCQFSWWCDGRSDWPQNHKMWQRAEKVAHKALHDKLTDPTGGSLYYHHTAILPSWRMAFTRTAVIGRHAFYR